MCFEITSTEPLDWDTVVPQRQGHFPSGDVGYWHTVMVRIIIVIIGMNLSGVQVLSQLSLSLQKEWFMALQELQEIPRTSVQSICKYHKD